MDRPDSSSSSAWEKGKVVRICVISQYCSPHLGGIETIVREQGLRLARQGQQITVVSSRTSRYESSDSVVDGIRVRRVPAFNLLERRFGVPYPIFSPSGADILSQEIAGADICLIHSAGFMSSFTAATLCRQKDVPYVVYQEYTPIPYPNPLLRCMQRYNDLLMSRFVIQHAGEVLCISRHVQDYVSQLASRSTSLLYGGVDHERFIPHRRSKPTERFTVLTVRRLVYKNGVDVLLAAAKILSSDARIRFVIVGDGPERARLEKYIARHGLANCTLTGSIPFDLIPDCYRTADIFVLPSLSEGLGLAILEAMASGLPVIVTKSGGPVELVQNGDNGFIVDTDAPEQIAGRISQIANDALLAAHMGARSRELVMRDFNWDIHLDTLVAVLVKTARSSSGAD
jgi:D-inositol-3-phosphate glycosyltransferase